MTTTGDADWAYETLPDWARGPQRTLHDGTTILVTGRQMDTTVTWARRIADNAARRAALAEPWWEMDL